MSGPRRYCAICGPNHTHDTKYCYYKEREPGRKGGRKGAKGGKEGSPKGYSNYHNNYNYDNYSQDYEEGGFGTYQTQDHTQVDF